MYNTAAGFGSIRGLAASTRGEYNKTCIHKQRECNVLPPYGYVYIYSKQLHKNIDVQSKKEEYNPNVFISCYSTIIMIKFSGCPNQRVVTKVVH